MKSGNVLQINLLKRYRLYVVRNVKSGESLVYGKKDLNKLHLPRHENFFETNVEQDDILPCL